eukprot:PITA_13749
MVEKLDLKHLKHTNPYRVLWLQKGHQLLVDEQREVEFQIGRYKDKDGIKHTLVLIKEEEGAADTGETRALLVSGEQFLKQVEDSEIGYSVVKKARTVLLHTEITDLPMEIQQMLEEFTDIVVDDLPDKLPPKRSISHHIDFIPGASFPNKAAYQMSPKDNEEIMKQVQELLDKD